MKDIDSPITIALPDAIHEVAKSFAAQHSEQARQIYLNTLAVYAVQTYLHWFDIQSDLEQSDSWRSNAQALFQARDLFLPGIGRLECCAVLPGTDEIPAWDSHIESVGCVIVQIDQRSNQAALLGFVPIELESFSRSELRSLDDLLIHLDWMESGRLIQLRQWLTNTVELGWREAVSRSTPARSIQRIKPIDLGEQAIDLQIQITPAQDLNISIRVSAQGDDYLPEGLRLLTLDEAGTVQAEKQAKVANRWIEQKMVRRAGERFGITVALGEMEITENFMA